MKISQRGIDLIKKFEGCRLTAYKDAVGVWTIGYGHTANVKQGMKITSEQAEELLKKDVEKFEKQVDKYSKYGFNQNQFDALVSFAFNIGNIDQLTAKGTRTIEKISSCIQLYNKAGGKVLQGLVKRRAEERALFDEPIKAEISGDSEKPTNLSSKEEKAGNEAKNDVKTAYMVGKTYTIQVRSALNVRKGAGKQYGVVGYAGLTPDGKKHATPAGALKNGTRVTISEIRINSEKDIWLKIPSGWICAVDGTKKFVV